MAPAERWFHRRFVGSAPVPLMPRAAPALPYFPKYLFHPAAKRGPSISTESANFCRNPSRNFASAGRSPAHLLAIRHIVRHIACDQFRQADVAQDAHARRGRRPCRPASVTTGTPIHRRPAWSCGRRRETYPGTGPRGDRAAKYSAGGTPADEFDAVAGNAVLRQHLPQIARDDCPPATARSAASRGTPCKHLGPQRDRRAASTFAEIIEAAEGDVPGFQAPAAG